MPNLMIKHETRLKQELINKDKQTVFIKNEINKA